MGHGTQERTLAPTLPSEAEAILAKETSLVLSSRREPKRRTPCNSACSTIPPQGP